MLYQFPATNFRPNSLSVKIQVDITRICAERWGPWHLHGRGERERGWKRVMGGGGGEKIRELASEQASERTEEKEKERQRERMRERPTSARRRGREKEWKRENEGNRDRERKRKSTRKGRVCEKQEKRDTILLYVQYTTVPSDPWLPPACSHPSTFNTNACSTVWKQNTFWVGDCYRGSVLAVPHISKWAVAGTSLNCNLND